MKKPQYQHDCSACHFIGQPVPSPFTDDNISDAYICFQGGDWPTIVLRFGDDGPDYTTMDPILAIESYLHKMEIAQ